MKLVALAMIAVLLPLPALAGTTGSLTGTIVSERDGAPIADALVTIVSATQMSRTRSDARGYFAFVSLAPDVYTLDVEHDGFNPASLPSVSIFADESQRIAFTLIPALVFIVHHHDRAFGSPVRPGTISDIYRYSPSTISLFPPVFGDLGTLRMTPGITFGAGAPVTH